MHCNATSLPCFCASGFRQEQLKLYILLENSPLYQIQFWRSHGQQQENIQVGDSVSDGQCRWLFQWSLVPRWWSWSAQEQRPVEDVEEKKGCRENDSASLIPGWVRGGGGGEDGSGKEEEGDDGDDTDEDVGGGPGGGERHGEWWGVGRPDLPGRMVSLPKKASLPDRSTEQPLPRMKSLPRRSTKKAGLALAEVSAWLGPNHLIVTMVAMILMIPKNQPGWLPSAFHSLTRLLCGGSMEEKGTSWCWKI